MRQKLIEVGWKDELKRHCKGINKLRKLVCINSRIDLIRKKGLEKVTVEELVDELTIKGRATVPNQIKEDLLSRIKNYFEDEGY